MLLHAQKVLLRLLRAASPIYIITNHLLRVAPQRTPLASAGAINRFKGPHVADFRKVPCALRAMPPKGGQHMYVTHRNRLQIEPRFVGGRHKCRRSQRIGSQAARCCVHRVTCGQTHPCGELLTELSGTIPPPPAHASAGRRPASLGHGMGHVGRQIQVPTCWGTKAPASLVCWPGLPRGNTGEQVAKMMRGVTIYARM